MDLYCLSRNVQCRLGVVVSNSFVTFVGVFTTGESQCFCLKCFTSIAKTPKESPSLCPSSSNPFSMNFSTHDIIVIKKGKKGKGI